MVHKTIIPTLLAGSAMLLCGPAAFAQAADSTDTNPTASSAQPPPKGTAAFLQEASEGNMAEVRMGELAQQRGTTPEVRRLGSVLADAHTKNEKELQDLAARENVTLPSQPNAHQQKAYDHLSQLNGKQFDKAFVNEQIKDHKKDIAKYQKESKSHDPVIAQYATSTLPDLNMHLQMAETAQKQLASQGAGGQAAGE